MIILMYNPLSYIITSKFLFIYVILQCKQCVCPSIKQYQVILKCFTLLYKNSIIKSLFILMKIFYRKITLRFFHICLRKKVDQLMKNIFSCFGKLIHIYFQKNNFLIINSYVIFLSIIIADFPIIYYLGIFIV